MKLYRDVRVKWLLTDIVTSSFTPVITSTCRIKRYIMSSPVLLYLKKKRGLCARNNVRCHSQLFTRYRVRVAKFAWKFYRKSAGRVTPVRNCCKAWEWVASIIIHTSSSTIYGNFSIWNFVAMRNLIRNWILIDVKFKHF